VGSEILLVIGPFLIPLCILYFAWRLNPSGKRLRGLIASILLIGSAFALVVYLKGSAGTLLVVAGFVMALAVFLHAVVGGFVWITKRVLGLVLAPNYSLKRTDQSLRD
jgi:hypothetical protein